MQNKPFEVTGKVKIFPQKGGWHYISVPLKISKPLSDLADRGLIAIKAAVGKTSWDTSLLPMGDGTHFIALPAKVRKPEDINLGDKVKVSFTLRRR